MRKLPPFAAIRAFEAAARHSSFKAAAKELCVTPSAISHQVQTLETYLATSLFNRGHNSLSLTHTGLTYVDKLTWLLDELDNSTRDIIGGSGKELRVLSTPGFAARWLIPRIDTFPEAKSIRLRVSDGAPSTDFRTNDADIVIHWLDTPIDNAVVEPLLSSGRYPVINTKLKEKSAIHNPEDLLNLTLFHDQVMDGWAEWFDLAGVEEPNLPCGPCFAHCELATTAAEKGQGVALAYDAIVQNTLNCGTLVKLFETVTMPKVIYSVAYRESRSGEPIIRNFRDWIFSQAASDLPRPHLSVAAGS